VAFKHFADGDSKLTSGLAFCFGRLPRKRRPNLTNLLLNGED
jgi:hypothetical protein